MGRCCHIYTLMHDVETSMSHSLEISTEICVMLRKLQYQIQTNGFGTADFPSERR